MMAYLIANLEVIKNGIIILDTAGVHGFALTFYNYRV